MKTKALTIALAAMMAAPTVTPILAEDDTKTTDVRYSVTAGYEWIIHSKVEFGKDSGVGQSVEKTDNIVKVTKNVIPDGKVLSISVAGSGDQGAFVIKNGNTTLTYAVLDGENNIEANNVVLTVAAGTNTGAKNLTYRLTTGTGTAEVAGDYSGSVTYTAVVK